MQETREDADDQATPAGESAAQGAPGTGPPAGAPALAAERTDAIPEAAAEAEAEAEVSTPTPVGAAAVDVVDYKDRWLRAEAELQNYRRRARKDMDESRRAAEEAVLLDLVALLDDLERAVDAAQEGNALPEWAGGVSLVLQKGRDYLMRQGVVTVDPLGVAFDPAFHEAILEVDPPEGVAPGSVVRVAHKGYRRGERALRAARVVVARSHPRET